MSSDELCWESHALCRLSGFRRNGGGLVHSWKEDANEGSEEEQAGRGKIEPGTQAFFARAFTQTDLETHIEDGPGDHRQ